MLLIIVLGAMIFSGCGGPKLQSEDPSIRGVITKIYAVEGKIVGVMVEGSVESDTTYDKAMISFTKSSKFYEKIESEYKESSPDFLEEGQTVEVLFTGEVRTSYPAQVTAEEVLILTDK